MAASRKKTNWQRRYRGAKQQPRLHRADASPKASGQVSALFRPRPGRTRQLCRPLHSTALIRSGERRCGEHLRRAFRCVPTAANNRDRPQIGRAPRNTSRMSRGFARHEQAISQSDCAGWSRGYARPRPALARDASHGQDTAIGREAPPGQDIGINREHDHFPTATLRWRSVSLLGKMADLTDKTNLV